MPVPSLYFLQQTGSWLVLVAPRLAAASAAVVDAVASSERAYLRRGPQPVTSVNASDGRTEALDAVADAVVGTYAGADADISRSAAKTTEGNCKLAAHDVDVETAERTRNDGMMMDHLRHS